MKTLLLIILAIASVLPTSACGTMSAQSRSDAISAINGMVANGSITQKQGEALIESLGSGVPLWQQLATALLGAGLAYVGVMKRRGPVTQEVGIPDTLVKKTT